MISFIDYKPELINEWHCEKNLGLIPTDISYASNKKVWWLSPCGHEWQSIVANRTKQNTKCPFCRRKKVNLDNCLATTHHDLCEEWHPTKNMLKTTEVVCGTKSKVWWKCSKGHDYECSIVKRVNGRGCPYCSNKKVCKDNCLATTHPDLCKEWHPTKNILKPVDVVSGSDKFIWWICENGHEWNARVCKRKTRGCPYCKLSKGELKIRNYLLKSGCQFEQQFRFSDCKLKFELPFDFLVRKDKNYCIEFHGEQHYVPIKYFGGVEKFEKLKIRDKTKTEYCSNNGIPLLIIPYYDYKNIEEIVREFLC